MSVVNHRKNAPKKIKFGIITVSSSRTLAKDKSGAWIKKRAIKEGHEIVCHKIIPDDAKIIAQTVYAIVRNNDIHALLLTGGTGISGKDVTIEAVRPMFEKELTAFGAIFAQLSFEDIDSAAILSRATAGITENVVIFCIPGSFKACKLACKALIFPELGHLVKHACENLS